MYQDPSHKRDIPRKVRFNSTLDRILQKAATRAGMQYATFLHEIIEYGVENGAIDELIREHQNKISAA